MNDAPQELLTEGQAPRLYTLGKNAAAALNGEFVLLGIYSIHTHIGSFLKYIFETTDGHQIRVLVLTSAALFQFEHAIIRVIIGQLEGYRVTKTH